MKKLVLILALLFANFCFASEVVIIHTSDTHGRISPIEYNGIKDVGGFSKRVQFINELKKQNKNILLLDSGDYFQGSLYYKLDEGKSISKLLPEIKYDAITLGNHEFDDGIKVLKSNIKNSKTQFLSANVHFQDKYLKIGVTTSQLSNLSDTSNITVTNAIDEIKSIIAKVKYDRLIIVSHCGLDEDRQIAKAIPNIDLILGGHNHYFFYTPEKIGNVPIVQNGEFGVRVGIIKFDKKVKSYTYKGITPDLISDYQIDKKIAKINKNAEKTTKKVLAKSETLLIGNQNTIESNQTNLGKLVLISMTKAFSDYDAVLTNSGSIRINKNFKGDITYANVLEILPFENNVVMVEIQGKYLKQILKTGQQHNRRYLQYYVKDKQIDDNKTYKVITNSYIAAGKDNYSLFKHAKFIKTATKKPRKLLIQTLKDLKVLTDESINFVNH